MPNWKRSSDAMPRLVPDQQPWHSSAATVCVGPGEYPRRLNGSCGQVLSSTAIRLIDFVAWLGYQLLTPTKRARETGPALIATLFPSFEKSQKWVITSLPSKQNAL